MQNIKTHRIVGFAVFLITLIVYILTVQSSVSFWDCGEFIASSYSLQVPHPPGTPFFLLLGRLFSLIPFADNIALRVNMISVISSAFTILFTYLVGVKLIFNITSNENKSFFTELTIFISAAIGALSLAFSDTFWFNAVEAEVYALATFFMAFAVWMTMVWNEKADEPDNEKYIIFVSYLIGLSTGVHLLALLAIPSIVMVIMFRKYVTDTNALKESAKLFLLNSVIVLIAALLFWINQTGTTPPTRELYKAFDQKVVLVALAITAVFILVFRKKIIHKNSFYLPLLVGGIGLIVVYPGIVKYIPGIISSIGKNDITFDILLFVSFFAVLLYIMYWTRKNNKETFNFIIKCLVFAIIGFASYATIIIRSNQDTPINLNSPKSFPEFVKYLNREQYGEQPFFKRRFSAEPHQQHIYTKYSSDLDFFWSYQMNHMFNRYLMWNYAGRESTIQDAKVDFSKFYGIPLFLGLLGIFFNYKKDWKMASVFLIVFIFLGYLTAFYQNQQQPQPRERDYFYVGAFFVYSIWIGLGTYGIIDMLKGTIKTTKSLKIATAVILIISFFAVPINMLSKNYFEHDRARNFVPWDYSYNILQSVAPNAVLFTNGDNDTFPLWYLQDVEGIRRDVRIANLSLLNTSWYIKQLKNTSPYGAKKVKMTLSDQQIDRIAPSRWNATELKVDILPETYKELGITDTSITNKGELKWTMKPSINFGDIKAVRAQDIVAMDIVRSNINDRPIYFAVTTPDNAKIGLDDYMLMEGLAFRVVPKKFNSYYSAVNPEIMWKQIMEEPENFDKEYKPGYKFRGLSDSTIFMNDNHKRLTLNYRNSFIRLAFYYIYVEKNNDKAIQILDKMESKVPYKLFSMDYRLLNDVANLYNSAGGKKQYLKFIEIVENEALQIISDNPLSVRKDPTPLRVLKDIYDTQGRYEAFLELLRQLKKIMPNDPSIDYLIKQYQQMASGEKLGVPEQNK
ncbi:MAG: membrane protein [Ignavibacteriae bacterium]|nr:MAG: membrane protein [Ignavibacteriota bacterium]